MKTYERAEQDSTLNGQVVDLTPALREEKEEFDYLFRAKGTSINDLKITFVTQTTTAEYRFRTYLEILIDVIRSQQKQLEFNSYYIAYLLGQIDDDEFEKISKKFVQKKKKIPMDQLKEKVLVVTKLTGHDVTPMDIAQYLFCDEEDVIKAFKLLT
jgi:hypothetical protein